MEEATGAPRSGAAPRHRSARHGPFGTGPPEKNMNEPERPAAASCSMDRICAAHFELYSQYQTKDGAHPPFHGRSVITRERREICCCRSCQMWIRILCSVSRSALIGVLWRLLQEGRPLWTCLTQEPSSFYIISVQIILNLEQTDEFFSEADIPDWANSSLCRSGQVQSLLESSLLWGVWSPFVPRFLFYSLKTGLENTV